MWYTSYSSIFRKCIETPFAISSTQKDEKNSLNKMESIKNTIFLKRFVQLDMGAVP